MIGVSKKGNPKVKQHEWFVNGATHSGKGQSVSSFRNLNISHSGTPKSSTLDRRFHYKSFISGDVPFLGNLHIFDVAGIQMLQGYSDIAMVDLGKPSRSPPCRTQESRRPRSQRPGKKLAIWEVKIGRLTCMMLRFWSGTWTINDQHWSTWINIDQHWSTLKWGWNKNSMMEHFSIRMYRTLVGIAVVAMW